MAEEFEGTAAVARPENSGCQSCWDVPGGVTREWQHLFSRGLGN